MNVTTAPPVVDGCRVKEEKPKEWSGSFHSGLLVILRLRTGGLMELQSFLCRLSATVFSIFSKSHMDVKK